MADFVFNINRHLLGYYASLPAVNDALMIIPLQASGLAADSVLRDLDTLAQVLANATEQTTMGRKSITSTTVTIDDANDRSDIGSSTATVTWTKPNGATVAKFLVCRQTDTTTNLDANLQLLAAHDPRDSNGNVTTVTPDGVSDVVLTIPTTSLYRVT